MARRAKGPRGAGDTPSPTGNELTLTHAHVWSAVCVLCSLFAFVLLIKSGRPMPRPPHTGGQNIVKTGLGKKLKLCLHL